MFTVQSCWGSSVDQEQLNESLFGAADLISCKKKEVCGNINNVPITKSQDNVPVTSSRNTEKNRRRKERRKKGKYIVQVAKSKELSLDEKYEKLNGGDEKTQVVVSPTEQENKEPGIIKTINTKKRKRGKHEDILSNNKREKILSIGSNIIAKHKNTFVTKQKSQSELNELNEEPSNKKKKNSIESEVFVIEETKNEDNEFVHVDAMKNLKKEKKSKSNIKMTKKEVKSEKVNKMEKKKNDKDENSDNTMVSLTKNNGDNDDVSVNSFDGKENLSTLSIDSLPVHRLKESKKKSKKKNKKKDNDNEAGGEQGEANTKVSSLRKKVTKKEKKKIKKEMLKAAAAVIATDVFNSEDNKNTSPSEKKVLPIDNSKKGTSKYNKFQQKIKDKLKGAQFRWINEKLYTCKSSDAVDMFSTDPKLFDVYHDGFTSQVQQWPQNPVDVISNFIKARDNIDLMVADFGCGDAKLSKNVPNKVHSFDLVAANENVTACDMRKVPLSKNAIDIAVFCLSLMGTNVIDFLKEAHRVLKVNGTLKIAEVKSRFEDADEFIKNVSTVGFNFVEKDESNKMFVLLEFEKTERVSTNQADEITLKPCIYKRR